MTYLLSDEEIQKLWEDEIQIVKDILDVHLIYFRELLAKAEPLIRAEAFKEIGELLDKKWESAEEIVLTRKLIDQLKSGIKP